MDWIGKDAVIHHDQDVPFQLLDWLPGLAGNSSVGGNIVVRGDNLIALRSLLPYLAKRVKCIFIDPPYNTGTEKWIYNDAVNSPEIRRWLGQVVGPVGEDLTRHDKWLCMMYPRLRLLREFLSDDGVIFVTIDENEAGHLANLMDEIFLERNRIGILTWVRKKKGSHLSGTMRKMTDFVFAYAKEIQDTSLFGEPAYSDKLQPLVKRTNASKTLTFPANLIVARKNGSARGGLGDGKYAPGIRGEGGTAVEFLDELVIEGGIVTCAFRARANFVWTQEKLDEEITLGTKVTLSNEFGFNALRWNQAEKFKRPRTLLDEDANVDDSEVAREELLDVLGTKLGIGTNEDASRELSEILGVEQGQAFPYPKPVSLIHYLVRAATKTDPTAIVLDSFAGSGTTGHAVLKLNSEDGGTRRFVLVELEPHIFENVTVPRLRNVMSGYSTRSGQHVPGLGGSINCATLGERLLTEDGDLNSKVSREQLAQYVYYLETRRSITRPISSDEYLDTADGVAYYLCSPRPGSKGERLVLDLDSLGMLREEATSHVVYAEACHLDGRLLKSRGITFRQLPYDFLVNH
ncbi:MAG TPA: site-specific DNA-methyltransferase [Candidatus Eremiobacteraceae bacterium]|nr:site-specific DNA-methyltransferase [Candidatus Eremiobacteraceae bacterium]